MSSGIRSSCPGSTAAGLPLDPKRRHGQGDQVPVARRRTGPRRRRLPGGRAVPRRCARARPARRVRRLPTGSAAASPLGAATRRGLPGARDQRRPHPPEPGAGAARGAPPHHQAPAPRQAAATAGCPDRPSDPPGQDRAPPGTAARGIAGGQPDLSPTHRGVLVRQRHSRPWPRRPPGAELGRAGRAVARAGPRLRHVVPGRREHPHPSACPELQPKGAGGRTHHRPARITGVRTLHDQRVQDRHGSLGRGTGSPRRGRGHLRAAWDLRLLGDTRTAQGMLGIYRGHFEAAGALFTKLYDHAVRYESLQHQVWASLGKAASELRRGRPAEAAHVLERVLELLVEHPDPAEQIQAYGLLACARWRQGEDAPALAAASSAANLMTKNKRPTAFYLFEGYSGVAEVHLDRWAAGDRSPATRQAARQACAALHTSRVSSPSASPGTNSCMGSSCTSPAGRDGPGWPGWPACPPPSGSACRSTPRSRTPSLACPQPEHHRAMAPGASAHAPAPVGRPPRWHTRRADPLPVTLRGSRRRQ